jgi:DNA processing protein
MDAAIAHLRPGASAWPEELDRVPNPPEELWAAGKLEILRRTPRVAIVGTRSPTPYGEAQAERFGGLLARHGVAIVSGLARGIDQAAHRGALEEGGTTLAVLGCGVDRPWPEGELTQRMRREGLLLSEFPPGQGPRRHHFPWRNRLIAALARCVVVVEAAQASGSLITAHWAVDLGREVYAVPGRIDHPMARGCHRLIREGAELLESPGQLLEDLGIAAGEPGPSRERGRPHPLLEALRGETLTADELALRLAKSSSEVLVELVGLELEGFVARGPGGLYRRLEH